MKKIIEDIIEYAGLLIKPPLTEVGLMLQDGVKFWRYKRQVKLIEKVKEFHNKKGILPTPVPLKTFAAIIEHSSLEEDEELHDMWAMLLSKASSPGHRSNTNLFCSILKELSPEEARTLSLMYEKYFTDEKYFEYHGFQRPIAFNIQNEKRWNEIDKEQIENEKDKEEIITDNLIRLNLIAYEDTSLGKGVVIGRRPKEFVKVTRLGKEFLKEVMSIDD